MSVFVEPRRRVLFIFVLCYSWDAVSSITRRRLAPTVVTIRRKTTSSRQPVVSGKTQISIDDRFHMFLALTAAAEVVVGDRYLFRYLLSPVIMADRHRNSLLWCRRCERRRCGGLLILLVLRWFVITCDDPVSYWHYREDGSYRDFRWLKFDFKWLPIGSVVCIKVILLLLTAILIPVCSRDRKSKKPIFS